MKPQKDRKTNTTLKQKNRALKPYKHKSTHKQYHRSNTQSIDGQITNPSFEQLTNIAKMKELSILKVCAQTRPKEH